MIRTFRHGGLRRLYERGDASKIRGDQATGIKMMLADLDDAVHPRDLALPGYRLHPLKGDMKGYWSIRVSANWRLIFRFKDGDVYDLDLIDYH
jgi:proteic killer suppression protein